MRRPPAAAMRHARQHVRIHPTVPAETALWEGLRDRAREGLAETVPREHPEPDPEVPDPRDPHLQEHVPLTVNLREHPEPDPEVPDPRDLHPQEHVPLTASPPPSSSTTNPMRPQDWSSRIPVTTFPLPGSHTYPRRATPTTACPTGDPPRRPLRAPMRRIRRITPPGSPARQPPRGSPC